LICPRLLDLTLQQARDIRGGPGMISKVRAS
jgi:hypothetical protein